MAKKKTLTKVKKLVNYYSENTNMLHKVLNNTKLKEESKNYQDIINKLTKQNLDLIQQTSALNALLKGNRAANASNISKITSLQNQITNSKDKIADLQKQIPASVLQTINMHPFTHAAAFGAGYGTAKLGDRFKKRVLKKDLDSDTNITGGLFNFGKQKNKEISYLNKRLNKNILSKFMSFDSDDNRKLNYNHPILQNDPDLLVMINSLISDTRSLGKYYTSERDLAKLRKKINQVERYIYDKYPKLFYSNGNNGETTDLRSYLNKNQKVPMDYIPDMASALNQEKDLVDKKLEPGKWRKRLQKWIS